MAIKIDCPRCKQNLLVPNKKAGSYATCPRCGGRFWVSNEASGDSSSTDAFAAGGAGGGRPPQESAISVPAPPPAPPRYAAGMATLPPAIPNPPGAAPPPPMIVPLAPPSMKSGRKVARLIAAEVAESVLKPAADGRLPGLQLQEDGRQQDAQAHAKSVNPLVLYGAITLSVVVSLLLVLGPDWSSPGQDDSTEKEHARKLIAWDFFGGGSVDAGALKPYQDALRAAKRAHARGDSKTEYECYGKVLKMLHADRGVDSRPLTGDGQQGRKSDKELETCIETILKGT